jgi:cellulose binding protein with CBM2 domain
MLSARARATLFVLTVTAATALVATTMDPVGAAPFAAASEAALLTQSPPNPSASASTSISPRPTDSLPSSSSGPAPARPGPINGLRVAAATPGSITLAWDPIPRGCCDLSHTIIEFSDYEDAYLGTARVERGVDTVTVTDHIRPTGEYFFSVTAVDVNGLRSYPQALTVVAPNAATGDVTPPASPSAPAVDRITTNGVRLAWAPATDNVAVTGYNIYRISNTEIASTLVARATGTSVVLPFDIGAVASGGWFVRARDAAGNLSFRSEIAWPPAAPVKPCGFAFRYLSERRGMFTAEVTVTNPGWLSLDFWWLAFRFGGDQRIASVRGAQFSQDESLVVLNGPARDRAFPAGGSVTAIIAGRSRTDRTPPDAATLNGVACVAG